MEEIKIEPENGQPNIVKEDKLPLPLKIKSQTVLIAVLAVLTTASLVFAAYNIGSNKKNKPEDQLQNLESDKIKPTEILPTKVEKEVDEVEKIKEEGVTWLKPEKLDDLGLFEKDPQDQNSPSSYQGTNYYKVAVLDNGGEIILAEVKAQEMGISTYVHRFLKRDGKFIHLSRYSDVDSLNYGSYRKVYANFTAGNSDLVLKSLTPGEVISFGSTDLVKQGNISGITSGFEVSSDSNKKDVKINETKWGGLYLETNGSVTGSNDQVLVGSYYVQLNDSTKAYYEPRPIFARDDGTFNINWTDPKAKSLSFAKIQTGGCGLGGGIFPFLKGEGLPVSAKEIGTSEKQSKIYFIDDVNDDLVKFGYKAYLTDQMPNKKPVEEFIKDYGLVFWKNDLGQTVVYLNSKYVPAVECGKPVIYLYPEKEMNVSVKVGARIRQSDPVYKNGWNVHAGPTGQLTVEGKIYDSLYWDGLGEGVYPEIKNGTVVKRDVIEETIRRQLADIGLNDKEIGDFLVFWLPKMPSKKYVRLTWLLTGEMNRLAPLQIKPQPQSLIRVFLDFEGYDNNVFLEPQILPHYNRRGFTVVEWGGLLKGNGD